MSGRTRQQQVGGVVLALVWGLMLWLSFPGLDDVSTKYAVTPEDRAQIKQRPLGPLELLLVDFNRSVRAPSVERLNVLEWPLRLKLNFFLYPNGPSKMNVLEIRVDGALVHRSNDPTYAWKARELATRRLRPVVYSTTRDLNPKSWKGLIRWLGQEAERELSGSTVELTTQRGSFPGTELRPVLVYRASAPLWDAERERLE